MRGGLGVVIAGVLLAFGCQSEALFQCQTDDQCVADGASGRCQPSGYCSFSDGGCDSGFRYGDSAPPGLAGQCVEPTGTTGGTGTDPGGSATTPPGPTSGSDSTSTPATSSSDGPSGGSTAGTESSSAEATSLDGSSSSSGSSGGSSSTGGQSCPQFVDEFDNGVIEEPPWVWFPATPSITAEVGGALRFLITPGLEDFEFLEMQDVDVANGFAVAHLISLPQDEGAQFLLRVFPSGGDGSVELTLTGSSELSARIDGMFFDSVDLGEDTAEIWMELYFEPDTAHFAYSLDGDDFVTFTSVQISEDYSDADISIMGGAYQPTVAPLHFIEVDDFEFCSRPFEI